MENNLISNIDIDIIDFNNDANLELGAITVVVNSNFKDKKITLSFQAKSSYDCEYSSENLGLYEDGCEDIDNLDEFVETAHYKNILTQAQKAFDDYIEQTYEIASAFNALDAESVIIVAKKRD